MGKVVAAAAFFRIVVFVIFGIHAWAVLFFFNRFYLLSPGGSFNWFSVHTIAPLSFFASKICIFFR
jgi:hypothetical protein